MNYVSYLACLTLWISKKPRTTNHLNWSKILLVMVFTSLCLKIPRFSNKMHRRNKQSWISDGKTKAAFWTLKILYGPSSSFDSGCVCHHKSGQKISDLTLWFLVLSALDKPSEEGVSTQKNMACRYFWCTVEVESYNPLNLWKKTLEKAMVQWRSITPQQGQHVG